MTVPIPIPVVRTERCVLYCLSCGRGTTAAAYVVEALFGWLPFGRITNRLHCRKGCGDRFGMVLPMDAPTPRQFAEKYTIVRPPPPEKPVMTDPDLEADCRDQLIEVGEGGTFLKVHAKAAHMEIVHWGFDFLLKKFADRFGGAPHLIVARGAQWSRDSKRDFKVVGGKVIKLRDDEDEADPEEPC